MSRLSFRRRKPPPGAPTKAQAEKAIRARERRDLRAAEQRSIDETEDERLLLARAWQPYMTPLFIVGLICAGVALLGVLTDESYLARMAGGASVAFNAVAHYAIRKGRAVQPTGFPVVYQASIGTVKGVTFTLVAALLGALTVVREL
jgi:hypothetical protein